jgi:hypothetical protein
VLASLVFWLVASCSLLIAPEARQLGLHLK